MSIAGFNRIIKKNEEDANKSVAKVMLITIAVFTVVYVLNLFGIFVIDKTAMTIAYAASAILLALPVILNKLLGPSNKALKYIYVIISALFLLIVTTTLTYHAVVIYAYPIALAGMYFSKRMTRFSAAITSFVTVLGQVLGYYLNWRPDHNFDTVHRLVFYSILPRLLTLLSFAALLDLLTRRTSHLLEEDAENYERQVIYSQDMIYGFATLVESRDENTGGHIRRTSVYSEMLANKLREKGVYSDIIDDSFIKYLSMAAPLHDIGKIAIPDSILCKPGKLTDEEFAVMKTHAEKGGEIIRSTFAHVADEKYRVMTYEVARYHHEKWNGKGYPIGLSSEDIPLAARIMSVADVFDAVSEKRCYRDAMPLDECFKIISDGIGRDFDPEIAKAFLEIRDDVAHVRENIAHSIANAAEHEHHHFFPETP